MLKVHNGGRKHWNDSFSWGMVKVMHSVLLNVTKARFAFVAYISISINELITINNTQWLSIYLYALSKLGRGFQSSSMLKQLGSLPLLITYML